MCKLMAAQAGWGSCFELLEMQVLSELLPIAVGSCPSWEISVLVKERLHRVIYTVIFTVISVLVKEHSDLQWHCKFLAAGAGLA